MNVAWPAGPRSSAAARCLFAVAALLVAWPACTETPPQILKATERVADWQLAHLQTEYVPAGPADPRSPRGWAVGTFFVGLTALADRSGDPRYAQAVYSQGRREHWMLEGRAFHADDYLIGQAWIWAYDRGRDPAAIAAVKERLDAIIDAAPRGSLDYGSSPPLDAESACQKRWCWVDALFMGPPTFAALAHSTRDERYTRYADAEFWAAADFLWDPQESLFFRDSRFFTLRGPHGEKIFWSRGNGWAYAGLARLLSMLPADHPNRPRYEALFRSLSARLVKLQKPDGYWPASLLAPPAGTPPESSGTALFTFGLASGVQSGLLPESVYRTAARRGWAALERAAHPDGRLGWVQPIGASPDAVSEGDTEPYGVGAFLLAGAATYDLALGGAQGTSRQAAR
jgi:rhamnogalacturonyl hydrolase YesR